MFQALPLPLLTKYPWRFFRAGGFDQVRLDTGDDLKSLDQLDQKLWVALACPTRGLEFDNRTLDLIDTDKDGRIRAPEIIAAVKWAISKLKNADELVKGSAALPLAAIDDRTPEGQKLLASAKQVLRNLGKRESETISVDDVTDTKSIFAHTRYNGDGVITPDGLEDPELVRLLNEMMSSLGSAADRSNIAGVDKARVEAFFKDLNAYVEWHERSITNAATILPLAEATAAGAAAIDEVRCKIDDYFARCKLAAFDARALAAINRQEADYLTIAAKDMSIDVAEVAGFPLALIAPNKPLPLNGGLNPAWSDSIAQLNTLVIQPLLGPRIALTPEDWATVQARLAPYVEWQTKKVGGSVEKLGIARIREILASDMQAKLLAMIEKDLSLAAEFQEIANLERLVRYHRDLYKLLVNFVNFRDFYGRKDKAIFQAGTLYLDQRACDLCVRVEDMTRHNAMAHLSSTYLAYCDCVRKATNEKIAIVAAFTNGDSDNLMVGRNGVFYDRKGQDWDATITKIVENPISIRQAFWAPYKRLIRWVQEQVAKRAAAADAAAGDQLTKATEAVITTPADPKEPAPKPKIDVGTVAALGVAFGGITAALGAILQAFFGLGIWMPLGIIALVLLISGPSMIIAWLKLRQRNLGPILDANGWAVNARARINIPFGTALTSVATIPPNAQRDLFDPYADDRSFQRKTIIVLIIAALLAAAWYFGLVERVFPGVLPKSGYMLRTEARLAEQRKLDQAAELIRQRQTGHAPTPTPLHVPGPAPVSAPAPATPPTP